MPNFPKVKSQLEREVGEKLRKEQKKARNKTFLSHWKYYYFSEGNRISHKDPKGNLIEDGFIDISKPMSVKTEKIIEEGHKAFEDVIPKTVKEVVEEEERITLEVLEKVTEKTGNIINAKGKEFHEWVLDTLERMPLDFDERGNLTSKIDIIVSPENEEAIKKKMAERMTPELKKRSEQLILKKRKEWHDRESNRKLVD